MNAPARLNVIAVVIGCLLLLGCGGGGSGSDSITSQNGTLSLFITDAPVDNVAVVRVQFAGVTVKPQQGEPIEFLFDLPADIDLLTLTGENSMLLLNNETVPAGRFEWLELHVNAEFDNEFDSFVMEDTGGMLELEVPSGSQSGLRLVSGFTVTANQNSSFVIDWDLLKALTRPPGQPGWLLRPALRITDMTEFGSIAGTVADGLLMDDTCENDLAADTGNNVYVYEGHNVGPDDIGGSGVEPLTTAPVVLDMNTAGAYTYRVTFLSPGDYTLALNCQGANEDPEVDDDLTFLQPTNTTVVDDQESLVDFQ